MEEIENLIKNVLTTPHNTNRQVVEGQLATIVKKIQNEAAEQVESAKIKCFKIRFDADTDSGMAFMDDTPYRDFYEAVMNQEFFYVVSDIDTGGISGYYYPTYAEIIDETVGSGHFVLQRTYAEDLTENGATNAYVEGMDIVADDFDNVKIEWNDRYVISDSEYEKIKPVFFTISRNTSNSQYVSNPSSSYIKQAIQDNRIVLGAYIDGNNTYGLSYAGQNAAGYIFNTNELNTSGVITYRIFTFNTANDTIGLQTQSASFPIGRYLTTPKVGQILSVKSLSSLNPKLVSAYEFIDPPKSENPWELINTYTAVEGSIDRATGIEFAEDSNGKALELKKAILICEYPKYTGTLNIPVTPTIRINTEDISAVPSGTLGILSKSIKTIGYYEIELNGTLRIEKGFQKEVSDDTDIFSENFNVALDNVREYKVVNNNVSSITELGIHDSLTYAGCKFALYGVRI